MISAAPIPLLATHDVISGSSRLPWRHFRFDDVISGPSLDPMLGRALGTSPRKLAVRPHGHVGHMLLSDWLTKKILRSDWSGLQLTPYTTYKGKRNADYVTKKQNILKP